MICLMCVVVLRIFSTLLRIRTLEVATKNVIGGGNLDPGDCFSLQMEFMVSYPTVRYEYGG